MFTSKGYPDGYDLTHALESGLSVQGDKSRAWLHVTSLLVDIKLYERLYFTLSFTGYGRRTNYKYYDIVESLSGEAKLMLTYKF